jgi:helix-turn-helix protein
MPVRVNVRPLPARRLFTTREAAEILGRGENTLEQERLHGRGIPYIKMGRAIRYDLNDL